MSDEEQVHTQTSARVAVVAPELKAEFEDYRPTLVDPREGYDDYAAVLRKPEEVEARNVAEAMSAAISHRDDLANTFLVRLEDTRKALQDLYDNGYPENVTVPGLTSDIEAIFQAQRKTMGAADTYRHADQAASGKINIGTGKPKAQEAPTPAQ